MEELDIRIFEELQEDGRRSFTEVAKVLGVSEGTIRKRVTAMKKKGIIQIRTLLNPAKIGYNLVSIVGFHINVAELDQFTKLMENNPMVRYIAFVGGRYDVIAMVNCRSPEELYSFIRDLSTKMNRIQTESFVNLKILKTPWLLLYDLRALVNAADTASPKDVTNDLDH